MRIDIADYDWQEKTRHAVTVPGAEGGYSIGGGNNREEFEDMIAEHVKRFHKQVADHAVEVMQDYGAERLILGGDERTAHTLRDLLPQKVSEQVVAVLPIPLRANPQQIMDLALPPALEYERHREVEIVQQVTDFAKSGGRGALGHGEVKRALHEGRVELLVLTRDLDAKNLRELSLQVLANNAKFEFVYGEAAALLKREGGMGARLYYAYPTPNPSS
jgi:peptide subunit release factor 1 (eRF1)